MRIKKEYMEFNEIIISDEELTENEVFQALRVVIDTLLEKNPSSLTKNSLKRVFRKKISDSVMSNDGIWYELYHHLAKEENNVENFDMNTLEKVETGIDLLSFTENKKILFSEMKSSIAKEYDYKLFCYGVLSQFTKNSKDIAQFSEFVNAMLELKLIDDDFEEKINNIIDSEEYDCAIAKNILMDDDYSEYFEFEVLLATNNMKETEIFRNKIAKSHMHKYSKVDMSSNEKKYSKVVECYSGTVGCEDISCVLSIILKLEGYSVRRDKLKSDFDLKKVYSNCIEYIDGVM